MWVAVFFIFFLIFIILICNKKLSNYCLQHKEKIEVIYILTSILTIFSIFFGVYTYHSGKKEQNIIQEEKKKIILQNLGKEIDLNLDLISTIATDSEKMGKSGLFTTSMFSYYYLEKSIDLMENFEVKERIFETVYLMKEVNYTIEYLLMSASNALSLPQVEMHKEVKTSGIDAINNHNKYIKVKLELIKDELNKKDK